MEFCSLSTSSVRSGRWARCFSSEFFLALSGRTGEMGVSSTMGCCCCTDSAMLGDGDGYEVVGVSGWCATVMPVGSWL